MGRLFQGSATALVTPFKNKGKEVDFEALKELIDFQIKNGTKALVVLGTTGEASTMTMEEKIAVVQFTVENVGGRIPVIAGSGSNDTNIAVKTSKIYEELKVDGLLIVTPYYNKCTQWGLIKHYTTIANEVDLPIILYNVPARTGVNMLPTTVQELSNIKNIVAVKEASGNVEQVSEIIRLCGENIDIYSGDDSLVLPVLSVGGKGVISVVSNIVPHLVQELCESFFDNDIEKSRHLQMLLNPLIKAMFLEVNPIPVKSALNLMDKNAGIPRLPLTKLEPENIYKLKKEMYKLGLISEVFKEEVL